LKQHLCRPRLFLLPSPRWIVIPSALIQRRYIWRRLQYTTAVTSRTFVWIMLNESWKLVTLSVRQSTETVVMCHSSSVLSPSRQGSNGVASCRQLPTTTDDTNRTKAHCENVPLWKRETERYTDKVSFIHLLAFQKHCCSMQHWKIRLPGNQVRFSQQLQQLLGINKIMIAVIINEVLVYKRFIGARNIIEKNVLILSRISLIF